MFLAIPPTRKPTIAGGVPPVSVNYSTEGTKPSVVDVNKQAQQDVSKPNIGLIYGTVFGVVALILVVCVIVFIIARKKRSPKLE